MKNAIPRYNFYKTKYGSELLIDVVDLQYTRKFLTQGKVHILTYYDITFITEGEGEFTIGNRTHLAAPGDVFFSKPGEVRSWDTDRIGNGHALIFEDTFLTSFFKDPLFVQHLPFFQFYADKLCITPNYLNEILSSAININAKQYILNKVTDEAQRLLTYTDLPISEIASELHFSTVSYFVRSFRQCIGYTPLAYRKMEKP